MENQGKNQNMVIVVTTGLNKASIIQKNISVLYGWVILRSLSNSISGGFYEYKIIIKTTLAEALRELYFHRSGCWFCRTIIAGGRNKFLIQ
jgi:hypothetical protein